MYLKSIEINGFKSFANKIVFEFPQGITGIVGPNGSGKSNIGDAVRWVLGEQSAKQLRGSKMEDVIFSGTQSRRPMGFAYVAITFENKNHSIPIDYEEVTVARRVYRSGESEYLLNGSTCRRRDIVELFYDTGIGKEGYSIIGQGQVEKILSGKIEDSRELFDEAAGIAKYKKNRATTEKSLEQERQNLERVTDILAELEKQVGPLEVQSTKAKEYLRLRDQEKDLDIHLFLHDYERIKKDQKEQERQAGIVSGHLMETRVSYEKIKAKNADFQGEAGALAERLAKKEGERALLHKEKEAQDSQLLLLAHKIESNTLLMEHYAGLTAQNEEDSTAKKASLLETQAGKEAKEKERTTEQAVLSELERELARNKEQLTACEEKVKRESDRQFSLLHESSGTKEKLGRYQAMEEQLEIRNAEYNSRYLSFNAELAGYKEKVAAIRKEREAAAETVRKKEQAHEALKEKEAACERQAKDLAEAMAQLNQDYLRAKSRYETLHGIAERYDGYNQSIRRVMERKKENPGILGVVADILTLPKEYETAIEIALGGALQNIVTADSEVAKRMIAFLKKNRFGRATFLPLTNIQRRGRALSPLLLEEEGVIGTADSLVKTEARYRNLVESLLGRTVVVDSIDHALALARKNSFSLRIVTLDGELLNPGGAITGGAFRHAGNLLGRKREMAECRETLRDTQAAWQEKKAALGETEKEQEVFAAKLRESEAALDADRLALHDLENELPALEEKRRNLDEQITSFSKEHRLLKAQLQDIRTQKDALLREQEDKEHIHEKNDHLLEELRARQEKLEEEKSTLEAARQEKVLRLAGLEQELAFLAENTTRLLGELEALKKTLEENEAACERLRTENAAHETERAGVAEKSAKLEGEERTLSEAIAALKDEQSALLKKQNRIFEELESESEKLRTLEKEEGRLAARKEHLAAELARRIDYMWESYELTYGQAKELARYAMTGAEAEEKRQEKREISGQIKALGPVNVNAIDEYREVGERYEFLKKQYEDIKEAEAKLLAMIEDLNEAMREQFTKEFGNIREQFVTVFQDLFEGGTASLELMDEGNILECGIRIVAQPPGKKLQNILLLSGGERALTAIALLFAIQKLKPSPFCLLDEIEAALDDANIVRFSKYLRRLSKDTQFIVITHRRGTMNAADALYGITMQEKGISTLISVDLIDKDLK